MLALHTEINITHGECDMVHLKWTNHPLEKRSTLLDTSQIE